MNLREAQDTVMPWGVHHRQTLGAIWINDRTYLTEFLASKRDTLDAWLREAVVLVIAEGAPSGAVDAAQCELFGDDVGEQSTGENL